MSLRGLQKSEHSLLFLMVVSNQSVIPLTLLRHDARVAFLYDLKFTDHVPLMTSVDLCLFGKFYTAHQSENKQPVMTAK